MNIIFFTQEDPFYVKIFFDEFFANYKNLDEIKAVVISRPMGKKSMIALAKQMYGLYGPINFLRVGFKYVFYKLMSKRKISKPLKSPARRLVTSKHFCGDGSVQAKAAEKSLARQSQQATTALKSVKSAQSADRNRPKTYSVKQTVESYGIEFIERSDINSDSFISMIRKYEPDLFISVASPIIFKESLINIPKLDCINIHNAPLPKYRGMLPNFWQLYHGEKEVGITVHKIETGIDTGDIITQRFVPIYPKDTLDNLIKKTKKENAIIIIDIIEDFRANKVQYTKMEGKGSYFSFPTRQDVKKLRRRDGRII